MKKPLAIARQSRRPSGLLGQIVARIMARETRHINRLALERLELRPDDRLLEVGCGHGWALAGAAQIVTRGRLVGVDPSEVMLRIAKRRTMADIGRGRVKLVLGCSDDLPFSDAAFDKALAVHTIYFWPSPERDLAEILRVLVPDGKLVLGFRPGDDPGFAQCYPSEIYNIRAAAAVEEAVRSAGFVDVRTEILTSHSGLLAFTEARKRLDPKE